MNTTLVDALVKAVLALSPEEQELFQQKLQDETLIEAEPILRGSKASDLLKFAGTWQGNDFEECFQLVYETRSKAEF